MGYAKVSLSEGKFALSFIRVHLWLIGFFIFNRVFDPSLLKAFQAYLAAIAHTAGNSSLCRIVTTVGHGIIHTQLQTFLDNFGFTQFDQWSVDF